MKKILVCFIALLLSLGITGCMKKEEDGFRFKYENMDFQLSEEFSRDKFGRELEYVELTSCAYQGLDKTFKYEHYEITTYNKEEKDYILSIYLLDDYVSTLEGVAITDTLEQVESVYGTNYERIGDVITYTKGKTSLKFYFSGDVIINIEYVYNL